MGQLEEKLSYNPLMGARRDLLETVRMSLQSPIIKQRLICNIDQNV